MEIYESGGAVMGLIWTKHKLFTGALFFALAIVGALGVVDSTNTYATASALSLGIDNNNLSLDIVPSMDGVFNSSASSNVTVSTNNATGYTLSIRANGSTDLVNTADSTLTIPSISSAISESDFSSSSTYNNMWGYKPSKFNSADNIDYLPSPSTTGDILDATSNANTTANTYTMALGARIDNNTPPGSYNNAFTIMAIANPLTYSVNYTNKSGVIATNMPANVVDAVTGAGEGAFTVSSTVPTRTGYTFNKWCTVEPTTTAGTGACTGGAEYASGATYELDATTNPQTVTLYAMWTLNSYSVTVNFAGSGVSGVTLTNTTYGGGGTVSTSGGTVSLKHGVSYDISGAYSSGYEFDSWATAANGTLGFTSSANTTYSVTGASTLTLTGKSSKLYMQNMSASDCTTIMKTVYDNRDETAYKVQRLADGNCWLLDNLALDLTNSTVLNGMDESNTHASNTTLNYLKGTTTRNPSTDPNGQYATAGVSDWGSSDSYSAPLVNLTNKDVIPSDATSQAGQYKVGGYYNFCAASAGSYCYGNGTSYGASSGDATEDICPKGWRLPTGNTTGEYQALYDNANYNTYANYRSALRLPLPGQFSGGSAGSQGSLGYFWSSTRRVNNSMYYLLLSTSSVNPSRSGADRGCGSSVRCVLGP